MVDTTRRWSVGSSLCEVNVAAEDYLDVDHRESFDFAILNPPYVRQEWLDRKSEYRRSFAERYDLTVPGTSNLYVYFLVKVIYDLKRGGSFICILYDSWRATKFGRWLVAFLGRECDQLEVVATPEQPFQGRLIDATILSGRRRLGSDGNFRSELTSAGNGGSSAALATVEGLANVGDLFHVRRGLRLKQADFFLCDLKDVSVLGATPFIKKCGRLRGYMVPENHSEAALLLSPGRSVPAIEAELKRRLALAAADPTKNVSILTWRRERPRSWNLHRPGPTAPFLFNYYLRNRPRHLLNPSRIFSDNFYGLTPRYALDPSVGLALLNSTAVCLEILSHSRNQGNGLAKIQLFEYKLVRIPDWRTFSKTAMRALAKLGASLKRVVLQDPPTIAAVDDVIAEELGTRRLRAARLQRLYQELHARARRPHA